MSIGKLSPFLLGTRPFLWRTTGQGTELDDRGQSGRKYACTQ